ncbi:hypothetical protein CL673_03215 [Candidatus Bathyarchaeota archaeon]|nr:hypothetical protein [Candidatus Bathyarchaeota archaeon]
MVLSNVQLKRLNPSIQITGFWSVAVVTQEFKSFGSQEKERSEDRVAHAFARATFGLSLKTIMCG